ncbi:MAG: UbiA family prenyltransferase [Candidatus Aenigmarchaeota archaeon]|nr:UbiA family prenyltransferase [Candidatus Aenigmarchaeota archaeon]
MRFVYLEILRPSVCILTAFAVLIGALLSNNFIFTNTIYAILAAVLIAGSGNILNDLYDYNIDLINKPKRPLPSKRISIKSAKIYAFILLFFAIIFLILLPIYAILLGIFNILIVFLYASRIKRTIFASFVDSWLSASTFIFGYFSVSQNLINTPIIILAMMAYSANVGREIAKAIEDIKGDLAANVKSIPIVGGKNIAILFSIFFVFLAIIISPIPFFINIFGYLYLILIFIADILFIVSCYMLFFSASKSQKIMKIAMFIALLGFLAGIYL